MVGLPWELLNFWLTGEIKSSVPHGPKLSVSGIGDVELLQLEGHDICDLFPVNLDQVENMGGFKIWMLSNSLDF